MKNLGTVLFLLLIVCASCKNGNPHNSESITNKQTDSSKPYYPDSIMNEHIKANKLIKKRLIFQLQQGHSYEYGSFDYYTMEDLEASAFIINELLAANGFKKLSNEDFDKRISDIFHRTIDRNSDSKFLCIDRREPCNKTMKLHPYSLDYDYYYISKKYNIILRFFPIPILIDYYRIYPDMKEYEKKLPKIEIETMDGTEKGDTVTIPYWGGGGNTDGDSSFVANEMININKYFFNNDTASLAWLLDNDSTFLDRLVHVFGYDKEQAITKAVLMSAQKEYYDTHYINLKNNNWVFDDLFATKDCNGQLQIREGLLKTVADETGTEHNELYTMLEAYCLYLASDAKDISFTLTERSKIIASICNTDYLLYVKYKGQGDTWNTSSLFTIKQNNPEIINEIAKNNYFGYPDLKKYIGEATQ